MFSNGTYAKLWEKRAGKGNYTEGRISTSAKDKVTEEYKQDFGAFVRFVGKAHDSIQALDDGDRFKIERCGVTNNYDKEKKVTYTNYVVFEISSEDSRNQDEENPFLS